MTILKVPIAQVACWDKNPRGIKQKDFDRLKKQILKLGVYKPLIAYRENGGYIVLGGNMRLKALQDCGIKEVDISIVDAPTQARRIEYAMSDNDRAGYYEEDALAELVYPHIKDIDLGEFKVDLGEAIDLKAVVERYGPDIDDGADEVPEVDDTPAVTRMGDLFTLRRHRLMCGDSTKAEDVARLMRGEKADMVFTDPPYGLDTNVARVKNLNGDYRINNDTPDKAAAFYRLAYGMTAGEKYICTSWNTLHILVDAIGLPDNVLVWVKPSFGMGHGYRHRYELVAYFGRGSYADQSDVWEFSKDTTTPHPTAKPIGLVAKAITNGCGDGQLISDPFLGSGTTLIAAEKTGRVCYGMEIDPKYCDVIIKRYADYAGVSEDGIRATRENPVG